MDNHNPILDLLVNAFNTENIFVLHNFVNVLKKSCSVVDTNYIYFQLGLVNNNNNWVFDVSDNDWKITLKNACSTNNLDKIKWITDNITHNRYYEWIFEDDGVFTISCINNNLDIAEWLLNNTECAKYNYSNYNSLFEKVCEKGYFDVAKLIARSWPNLDVNQNDNIVFYHVCNNGYWDIFLWLLKIWKHFVVDEYIFLEFFKSGSMMYCEFMISHFKFIDINKYGTNAVFNACCYGKTDLVIWLVNTWPTVEYKILNGSAFAGACKHGHLKTAKWLIENYPTLNIRAFNNYAYNSAIKNNHQQIVEWLSSGI